MEQNGKSRPLIAGAIVQVGGRGQAMVVADPDKYKDRWWASVPGSVVCEWTVGGVEHAAVHLADTLEVVGSKRRMSQEEVYDLVTARAVATVTALAGDGRSDMVLGALQMWSDLTGDYAQDADRLRLQQIADRAPSTTR
jgi:uncharacterized protein YodC (DUF2158 family)